MIISAIKSMQPISRHHENGPLSSCWFQRNSQEEDSVEVGITPKEAAERIQNVICSHIVKRNSESSDQLRALITKGSNGECANTFTVGDILVVSAKEFDDTYHALGIHGMIVHVNSLEPFEADTYEMSTGNRNEHTVRIGQHLDTRYGNLKMYFTLSPAVRDERTARYLQRNLKSGNVFKLHVNAQNLYIAFMESVEKLEQQRQKLSKYKDCKAPAYYGNYRCNNFVYDIVQKALELENKNY